MIGAHLLRSIVDSGIRPTVLIRNTSNITRLHEIEDKIDIEVCELTDKCALKDILSSVKPDLVYHLASTFFNPPTIGTETHIAVNTIAIASIMDALKEFSGVKIIYTGTAAQYSGGDNIFETSRADPKTIYGATKASGSIIGHAYASIYDINFVELRLFSPYGPWEKASRLIPSVVLAALENQTVQIGSGKQERDFIFISDVIDALLKAGDIDVKTEAIINVSSGEGVSIRGIAELILDIMGNPVELLVGSREDRKDELWKMSGNNQLAKDVLNWEPKVNLLYGLENTIEWISENKNLIRNLN